MNITVQYPLNEMVVVKTEEEMRALGYKSAITRKEPVNRSFTITVRGSNTLSADDICVRQTGMTPSEYQTRYHKAWNE